MRPPVAAAFDVDGTLLCDGSNAILAEDQGAITRLVERYNVRLLLVSGRPINTLWSIAEDLRRCDGVAGLDGVLAQARPSGAFLLDCSLSMAAISLAVENFVGSGGYVGCFSGSRWFAAGPDSWIDCEARGNRRMPDSRSMARLLSVLGRSRVGKVVLRGTPAQIRVAAQHLAVALPASRIDHQDDYLAVLPRSASKLKALRSLLTVYECSLEQTWAFGNGSSDIEMVSSAAVGIAMGDAPPSLRRAADHLTDTCEQSGIARAIDYLLARLAVSCNG